MHEGGHFVPNRPDNQVPVIRHDAVAEEPRWRALQRSPQDFFECLVVLLVEEQLGASGRPVQHMENQSAGVLKSASRHAAIAAVSNSGA